MDKRIILLLCMSTYCTNHDIKQNTTPDQNRETLPNTNYDQVNAHNTHVDPTEQKK